MKIRSMLLDSALAVLVWPTVTTGIAYVSGIREPDHVLIIYTTSFGMNLFGGMIYGRLLSRWRKHFAYH